ncbi:MAG: hypothetical protein IT223_01570, partial [Crocinitomicaceae bacterium]|nr:hypothetical protein [Crocinitomicaceae bacterium]
MRYTYIYIVFQFLVIQASAQADSLAGLNANTLKNLAKNAERLGDVYSSIGYFEAYTAKRGKDVEARYSLGKLYEASRNYDAAAQTYERVFLDAAEKYPEALYDQGRMQMMLGQYEAAKISFNQFISVIKKTDKRSLAKTAAIDVAGCDSAEILLSKPLNIEVKNLGSPFNSKHIDFSPLLLDDTHMIYGSLREEEIKYYDEGLPRPQRQFYTAEKKDGQWVNTGLLEGPVNDPKVHTGNGAISTDGERLYFTRCESDWKNNVRCALWVAKKAGNSWLEPEKLNEQINLPDYSSTQPAIGTESKKGLDVIYFVSNRPGGQGGNDIWFTVYDAKKNTYKEPLNAGKTINSERNETTPFYVDS